MGRAQLFGQCVDAEQAEVEAVCRDRVHAHRRIAHAGKAARHQPVRHHAHQRIAVACAGELHAAQPAMVATGHLLAEGGLVHGQQRLDALVRQREHRGGTVFARDRVVVHGQQCQRLAIIEPLPCHVVVRHLVRHLAHQHGAAEVVHAGPHAYGAARGREAAVGCHQQACAVCGAISQQHLGHLAFALRQHARDGLARHQRDAAVFLGRGLHLGIGSAADVMVGHQPAQLAAVGQRVANEHGEGGRAVEHAGIAQRREGGAVHVLDAFPQAQLTHEGGRALRECDLATIEGCLAQRLFRLLLHQTDGEARIRQGPSQTKTGRTGTADEEIEFHGQAPEKTGQGSLIDPRDSRLDGHHQAHGDAFSVAEAQREPSAQGVFWSVCFLAWARWRYCKR